MEPGANLGVSPRNLADLDSSLIMVRIVQFLFLMNKATFDFMLGGNQGYLQS